MSHLLAPVVDVVAQLRAAIDEDHVRVVTADPERVAQAIAGDGDVVVLVGMPGIDWATYHAHDVELPVYLIGTTLDYMRAWEAIDQVLDQILTDPDLVPDKVRPASYRPAPTAAALPALTVTLTQARVSS